jgi:hypothetical protein
MPFQAARITVFGYAKIETELSSKANMNMSGADERCG